MDTNQDSTEKEKPKPEIKMPIDIPKISMPKMPKEGFGTYIKNKLKEYRRVLKITKKPDSQEFKAIVKASGLGMIIIGVIGFIIHMIVQGIQLLS